MSNSNGLNILVCGSQRFTDRNFVFHMLDAMSANTDIARIYTSNFSGCSQFAREWVSHTNEHKHTNIKLVDFELDKLLETKNLSLYEQVNIPDFILREDPFFLSGKDILQKQTIKAVLTFPNAENILGTATLNIRRFAALAGIPTLDCADSYQQILQMKEANERRFLEQQAQSSHIDNIAQQAHNNTAVGLVNRHPGKKP